MRPINYYLFKEEQLVKNNLDLYEGCKVYICKM